MSKDTFDKSLILLVDFYLMVETVLMSTSVCEIESIAVKMLRKVFSYPCTTPMVTIEIESRTFGSGKLRLAWDLNNFMISNHKKVQFKCWASFTNLRFSLTIKSVSTNRVVLGVIVNRDIRAAMESAKDSVLISTFREIYDKKYEEL